MNGDILTDLDMRALVESHRAAKSDLTVATRDFALQHPYGVLRVEDGRIAGITEKPVVTDAVSAGIYVLEPGALELVPRDAFFDMPDLINALIAAGRRVGAYAFEGEWLAIDGLDQLEDAARMLAERNA
jgi:NDP-sugar pyrophosphorylase family protein